MLPTAMTCPIPRTRTPDGRVARTGRRLRACALLAVLWLAAPPALAARYAGRVTQVADGDTVTLRAGGGRQYRIRLLAIDAPEKDQAHGRHAALALRQHVLGRQAKADCVARDRYGRHVCRLFVADEDAGLRLLRAGDAWFFRNYARGLPPAARDAYAAAEREARQARRGLWRAASPVPPWRWRRR